jgi:parvulin-like peptidyl-prolyl isomerase
VESLPGFGKMAALSDVSGSVLRLSRPVSCAMKTNLLFCLAAFAAFASTTPAGAQSGQRATAQPVSTPGQTNGIAAVVNGRPILRSDVEEVIKVQEMQLRATIGDKSELDRELGDLRRKALDTLVEQELILKEFEPYEANFRDKVDAYADERIKTQYIKEMYKGDRAKFIKELTASGLSYKKFYEKHRTMIIVSMMRSQNVKDLGYVTSDEKQAYLRAHEEDFRDGDQIKLWSITIPKVGEEIGTTPKSQQALAKEIRGKLLRGDEFATLAKTYSQDSKSGNGGDWGVITKKDLTRRMAELVFALPAKKVSEVIEFEDSYYIFYVEAKIPGKMKPKEEVEDQLEKRVLMEKSKKAYEEWITQLKRKATISYK